ncbi:MAG: hypothetical protein ABW069_05780 [Duganella sp.]
MSDSAHIEALADSLSANADALHARLLRALRQRTPDAGEPLITQAAAQALFENEVMLRQRANGLYLDAAKLAATGLGGLQQQLLAITAQAEQKIARIERIKDLIALTGELLTLAAAVASGAPERLIAPYEKIKDHLQELN